MYEFLRVTSIFLEIDFSEKNDKKIFFFFFILLLENAFSREKYTFESHFKREFR